MIYKKELLNKINRIYMQEIKILYEKTFIEKNGIKYHSNYKISYSVFLEKICGKNVEFILNFSKTNTTDYVHVISADYSPVQRHRINIYITINHMFTDQNFGEVYLRVKSYLLHELEHHLQKMKIPFREKLTTTKNPTPDNYINAMCEIEAWTKATYFLHRKTKIPFNELLLMESTIVTKDCILQNTFRKNVYKFLSDRKDLRCMLLNIKF